MDSRWLGLLAAMIVGCGAADEPAQVTRPDSGTTAETGAPADTAPGDTTDGGLELDTASPTDAASEASADAPSDAEEASVDADAGPYVAPASDEVLCKKDSSGRLRWDGSQCWDDALPKYGAGAGPCCYSNPVRCTFQRRPALDGLHPACWPVVEATVGGWAACDSYPLYRFPSGSSFDPAIDPVVTVARPTGGWWVLEVVETACDSSAWSDVSCKPAPLKSYSYCFKLRRYGSSVGVDRASVLAQVIP